ncbi:hypothetical protein [Deinococcus pimensis]|uniref:hypothetical protein n=1 Tax=Deinococcus pimensis TaxID=309888 RepID=UPI0004845F9B|nr:hypothetical protein [Deinococcus pimensis]
MRAQLPAVITLILTGAVLTGAVHSAHRLLDRSVSAFAPDRVSRPSVGPSCRPRVEAFRDASWTGTQGYVAGGALVVRTCGESWLNLRARGVSLDGRQARLLIATEDGTVLNRSFEGSRTFRVPIGSAGTVTLLSPAAEVRLEDRNLFLSDIRFRPERPCFQAPPSIAPLTAGVFDGPSKVTLYADGALAFQACDEGRLSLSLSGTKLDGIGPVVVIEREGQESRRRAVQAPVALSMNLSRGEKVRLAFANDAARVIGERTIHIERLTLDR